MNNKVIVVDSNGNQIVAEGISYIVLSGEGYKHEYLFYTLNEVVNGDLTKIYVAKVNEDNTTIDDNEWENVKRSMLAIVHKEEVIGLSFEKILDEQGNSKTFKIDFPRKIALKIDKLMGLRDEYRIALSNPDSASDTPAVGGSQEFFDASGMQAGNSTENKVEDIPSPFDGTISPAEQKVQSAPVAEATFDGMNAVPVENPVPQTQVVQVQPVTVETVAAPTELVIQQPVAPAVTVEVTPQVQNTNIPAAPVTIETVPAAPVAPAVPVQVETTPAIQNVVPEPIPGALGDMPAITNTSTAAVEISNEEDFAIPLSPATKEQTSNLDSVIFDQIIEELNQIKNQNAEIRESIKRLSSNVEIINNNLSSLERNKANNSDTTLINTNTSNTTEEVSAIEINENGSVVLPDYREIAQSANNAVNALTNNVLEPAPQVVEQQIVQNEMIDPLQGTQMIEQPVVAPAAPETTFIDQQVQTQPIQMVPPQQETVEIVESSPVNDVAVIPTVQPVVVNQTPQGAPQTMETPAVIDQTPQLVPDVPVYGVNVPEPTIVVPQFDPNAGLPPVAMPTGVSAGDDASAISGMM